MKKLLLIPLLLIFAAVAVAQETEAVRQKSIDKAVAFLRDAQAPDGAFSPQAGIGPTAVVLCGLLDAGVKSDDPMVAKGLEFLKKSTREDGGVYTKDGFYQNYETCLAIMCFAAANDAAKKASGAQTGPYDELLAKAQKYLIGEQFTEANGKSPDDVFYGGAGYGKNKRPDLSNTHFFVEALRASGKPADDPAIQKALVFISRCQNMESEHNTLPYASKNPDGGFIYTAVGADAPQGQAQGDLGRGKGEGRGQGGPGQGKGGGSQDAAALRSYASMTYAGLKSMIYAGLTPEDKRVKAAVDWAKKHYDLTQNPGQGQNGLFYYYQTFAKALTTMKLDDMEDADGKKHDWKAELVDVLAKKQAEDGSWVNETVRWMEGDPNLVTGYVLMVLADCKK